MKIWVTVLLARPTYINSSATHNLNGWPFSPKNQRLLLSCFLYKSFFYGPKQRRRIYTVEKTKVVAAVWGTELLQYLAALDILQQDDWKNSMKSLYSFYYPGANHSILLIVLVQNSYRGKELKQFYSPSSRDDLSAVLVSAESDLAQCKQILDFQKFNFLTPRAVLVSAKSLTVFREYLHENESFSKTILAGSSGAQEGAIHDNKMPTPLWHCHFKFLHLLNHRWLRTWNKQSLAKYNFTKSY